MQKLHDAGFDSVRRMTQASKASEVDKVVGTIPAAQQDSATSNEIVILVGSGPATRTVPDVTGQTVDQATQNLNTAGFTTILKADTDGTLPVGQVASTDPAAGASVDADAPITLKVSRGNQFEMPDVRGLFYVDLVQYLASFGFTGRLDKGPDIDAGSDKRGKVVQQDPAPKTGGVNRDGIITVNYGPERGTAARPGDLTLVLLAFCQLGQHRVIGGQIGVVVAVGGAVQPGGGAVVAAPPLDQQREHHQHQRHLTRRPGNTAAETLIAQEIGMPVELQ